MDGDAWYYATGQEQKGPLTVDQISALVESGALDRDAFVWTPKMEDWMQVSQTELASLLVHRPPPVSPSHPPPPGSAAFLPTTMAGLTPTSSG